MDQKKGKTSVNDSINPGFKAKKHPLKSVEEYLEGIRSGNKAILSQAITLIESSRAEHQELGQAVLEKCLKYSGNSLRIGISGVPGVGKSTFIDALGKIRIDEGDKIAVLTIDPSSSKSGGSILGDKTRMEVLSVHPGAYVRPSPSSGTLGGVARKTREAMLLCEAAGYTTIFVETVGVGQSETAVHSMVDFFLVLMLPGAGDELQGIKRGIIEMADMIAVNKADGESKDSAERAAQQYINALSLYSARSSGWKPPVITCSARNGTGLHHCWAEIERYAAETRSAGRFDQNRRAQLIKWMYESADLMLKEMFYGDEQVAEKLQIFEKKVNEGGLSPFKAASELINLFTGK